MQNRLGKAYFFRPENPIEGHAKKNHKSIESSTFNRIIIGKLYKTLCWVSLKGKWIFLQWYIPGGMIMLNKSLSVSRVWCLLFLSPCREILSLIPGKYEIGGSYSCSQKSVGIDETRSWGWFERGRLQLYGAIWNSSLWRYRAIDKLLTKSILIHWHEDAAVY